MVEPFCQEEALFQAALEIDAADRRAAFLDAACGDQRELRQRLEALLRRNAESSGPLDRAGCGLAATMDEPIVERPGTFIGRYKLIEQIGEGGFGLVFMAEQREPVRRKVALKILKPGMDSKQVVARFEAERQALALMEHPNIAQVLDAGETASGRPFVVMELVKGIPITEYCDKARLSTRQRVHLFRDLCQAVQHAHQKGVIHRDLKPSNVLITLHGDTPVVKVIDFGIAKAIAQPLTERTLVTGFAQMIGTPLYMSPEQVALSGLDVDTRSDVYSLGVLLYELLTGTTPFDKETLSKAGHDELRRILREDEPPRPSTRLDTLDAALLSTVSEQRGIEPHAFRQLMRGELDWIVMKTLEKDRNRRYESASALAADAQRYLDDEPVLACPPSVPYRLKKYARRHKAAFAIIGLAAALLLLGGTIGFGAIMYRTAQAELTAEQQKAVGEQWVREHAIPHLYRLIAEKQYGAAFELAGAAERLTPGDPTLAEFWPKISSPWSVVSDPTGSDVYWKPYGATEGDWNHLGQAPLNNILLPRGLIHWKVTKEGYGAVEGCRASQEGTARFNLYKNDAVPVGMVRVAANQYRPELNGVGQIDMANLSDYFIDKYEVTNRQFKAFVDAGGYEQKVYWKQPFVKDKAVLSWETAMKGFCDASGASGRPAVWQSGTYPAGEDDYPVRGVSWFEAAAYAEFAGKSLPTITHWLRASGLGYPASDIVTASNFGRKGPAAVGAYKGVGPFGTSDMAGNVKEWCWNKVAGDQRFLLGGSWDEPDYMFSYWDAQSAIDRLPTYGFRCVKYLSDPIPEAAFADVLRTQSDYRKEKPDSDEQFRLIRTVYAYDKGPLNAEVTSRKELPDHIHETVRFDAAYGTEQVLAHLYLPRNVQPPYQTVIYFPAANLHSYPQEDPPSRIAFLVESGRAVLCPIYNGFYERASNRNRPLGPNQKRDLWLQAIKDYFRSVDYIERRTDLDTKKVAYFGESMGAWLGAMLLGLDDRAKVAVFHAGGFGYHSNQTPFPELVAINFAPRIKLPVLMLNGHNDKIFPLEINQRPLFESLGTPEKDKSHRLFDCGHEVPHKIVAQETVSWLDKYLGPVRGESK